MDEKPKPVMWTKEEWDKELEAIEEEKIDQELDSLIKDLNQRAIDSRARLVKLAKDSPLYGYDSGWEKPLCGSTSTSSQVLPPGTTISC